MRVQPLIGEIQELNVMDTQFLGLSEMDDVEKALESRSTSTRDWKGPMAG